MKNDHQPTNGHYAIKCVNLHFTYPDGAQALRGVNLFVKENERVGIIGPNGAGKSTLLTLLNGVRRGRGEVEIFGNPVNGRNGVTVKRLLGLVFQNPDDQLFCPTVFEDVAFGPLNLGLDREEIEERVSDALEQVGLSGYEQRTALNMSYGERKLLSLATVISMQPKILAIDEPTGNLDPFHRRKIIRWINGCSGTFVITSHDLDMVWDTCDRVVILNEGKITADGSKQEILTNEKLLTDNQMELPLKFQD
ncbi:MAG TPA: ABC transporter ATP-binding protein [Caldithrix abyssi]|uniref:ABC transporter ATP-binding protein n=1 Tax=Caldithrix abyssi TaxID=187145 RepID=A0A7V5PRE1_CALAY|nr:ABC transporter ATP-binding protein [Caldithrix abyssi]